MGNGWQRGHFFREKLMRWADLNFFCRQTKPEKLPLQVFMNFFFHVHTCRNDPKFSDRYAWANSAVSDQTAPRRQIEAVHEEV